MWSVSAAVHRTDTVADGHEYFSRRQRLTIFSSEYPVLPGTTVLATQYSFTFSDILLIIIIIIVTRSDQP